MIRAVYREGRIQPLDPVPPEWVEGMELHIESVSDVDLPTDHDALRQWSSEMERLVSEFNDPEEWARLDAALAEADQLAKESIRREMGLP